MKADNSNLTMRVNVIPTSREGMERPLAELSVSISPPVESEIKLEEIGERLRAFRLGRGLSPEALADRLMISRAALYRAEKGHIAKIETLTSIAAVLHVSLAGLLGVGVEYVDNAVAFFERMRQLESASDEIIGFFAPISYLLTFDSYDEMLQESLSASLKLNESNFAEAERAVTVLLAILKERKRQYHTRRPLIVSLIPAVDIERFLLQGAVERADLPERTIQLRRRQAAVEVRAVEKLLRTPAPGVQIGIVLGTTPSTTFQIFRQRDRAVLAVSPFRLGGQLNVDVGVGFITAAAEPMRLHEGIARRLWKESLKGEEAADYLARLLARHAP